MKKLVLLIGVLLGMQGIGQAQISEEDLLQEMQRMQKQLLEQMQSFGDGQDGFQFFADSLFLGGGNFNLQMDSLLQPGMDMPFFQFSPNDLGAMFKELERGMSQMTEEDWAELEQLFGQFDLPNLRPQEGESDGKPSRPRKDGQKKQKIYSL